MADLDTRGLTPLDTTGLTPVGDDMVDGSARASAEAKLLDTRGLIRLDTRGLKALDQSAAEPARVTPNPDMAVAEDKPPTVAPSLSEYGITEDTPEGVTQDSKYIRAATEGFKSAARSAGQFKGAVNRTTTQDEGEPDIPEAKPIEWGDYGEIGDKLLPKVIYGFAKSSPTLAAALFGGMAGGAAGAATPVPGGAIAGAIGGSAIAAAGTSAAMELGPYYQAALKETGDPDAAFDKAKKQAAVDGAISGVTFAAFGYTPFSGFVKNILLQAGAVQPALDVAGKAVKNVVNDRPVDENLTEGVPGAIANTLIPATAMHGLHSTLRGEAPTPGDSRTASQREVDDFLAKARGKQTRQEIDDFLARKAAEEAMGAPALPSPDQFAATPEAPPQAAPEAPAATPPEKPAAVTTAPADAAVNDALMGYGYTPEQIAAMTPAQRASEYQAAVESGAVPPVHGGLTRAVMRGAQEAPSDVIAAPPPAPPPAPAGEASNGLPTPTDRLPAAEPAAIKWDRTTTGDGSTPVGSERNQTVIDVDPRALDRSFKATSRSFYDLPAEPMQKLRDYVQGGGTLSIPEVALTGGKRPGRIDVVNGRHRIRLAAEMGLDSIPVAVDRGQEKALQSLILQHAEAPETGDGSRVAPVQLEDDTVHYAAERTAEPTLAQAEAGNYAKRHLQWNGLDLAVETEAGQDRKGVSAAGQPWSVTLEHPYGYIKRTEGADGDQVDTYIGPNPDSGKVFVFDQVDPKTGKFDEHKLVIGANNVDQASQIYEHGFSDGTGVQRWGAVTEMSVPELKDWLAKGDTTKPLALPKTKQAVQAQPAADAEPTVRDHAATIGLKGLTDAEVSQAAEHVANGHPVNDAIGHVIEQAAQADLAKLEGSHEGTAPGKGGGRAADEAAANGTAAARPTGSDLAAKGEQPAEHPTAAAAGHPAPGESAHGAERAPGVDKPVDLKVNTEGDDLEIPDFLRRAKDEKPPAEKIASDEGISSGDDEHVSEPAETAPLRTPETAIKLEADKRWRNWVPGKNSKDETLLTRPRLGTFIKEVRKEARVREREEAKARAAEQRVAAKAASKQQAKTEATASAKLKDYSNTIIPDPTEQGLRGDYDGGPTKDAFLADAKGYLQKVEKLLAERGFTRVVDRKGKASAVTVSEGGPAVSGDVHLRMDHPGGIGIYANVGTTMAGPSGGASIMAREVRKGERHGSNNWLRPDMTAGELADKLADLAMVDKAPAKAAQPTPVESKPEPAAADDTSDPYTVEHRQKQLDDAKAHVTRLEKRIARAKELGRDPQQKDDRISLDVQLASLERDLRAAKSAVTISERVIEAKKAEDEPEIAATDNKLPVEPRPEGGVSASGDHKTGEAAPSIKLADHLLERLDTGKPITSKILQDMAADAYGAKLAEGAFDRRDMADALELAVNKYVKDTKHLRVDSPDPQHAVKMLSDVLDELPGQRVRNEEQVRFQQFSTPPNYAAVAAYAANLKAGDTMLEPSAGTGSIVAASSAPGVKIIANELSPRRAELLKDLIGKDGQVFTENAEQLDNILPADVKPTVVVMNPPFSQTAGRMGDKKDQTVAQVHIEQALRRLEPNGRLVAIVGEGMTMGSPTHRAWFKKIGEKYAIRASIGVPGKVYQKYGTTFGTRVYVIDKVTPSGEAPMIHEAQSVEDLMRTLEPIRDARASITSEQGADQSSGAALAEGSEGARTGTPSVRSEPRQLGAGEQGTGGLAGDGSARAPSAGGRDVQLGSGERAGVSPDQSERGGKGRPVREPAPLSDNGEKPAAGGGVRAQRDLQSPAGAEPGASTGIQRVDVENAAPGSQKATGAISESLYDHYEPRRAKVKGAKPHPGPLVESSAMASVDPPKPTYTPHLPSHVVERGLLSTAQLEPLIYAGQAHEKILPAGEGETPRRKGYFIGDGTGVGKGREVAGIMLDNWSQGRTKHVWVSEKRTLLQDAKRDWKGLGQNDALLFDIGKVKAGEPVTAERGIGFITYDTLKGGMSDQAALARGGFTRKQAVITTGGRSGTIQRVIPQRGGKAPNYAVKFEDGTQQEIAAADLKAADENFAIKSRVDQIADWVGKDFDGVIAFDEAHNMANAVTAKGERGLKDAAQKALAGIELQNRLPNARVVYVSATGATEVANLAYADRLGLWGRGTPFASRNDFVKEVEEGGIAAMELIARDMKQLGLYTARNLSYDGVEYRRVEHKLSDDQREIYDSLAEAWQNVLRNITAALQETGGKKDSRAKSAALSAFWGAHQRFFNQIITSMQMPSVIKAVEADIAAGRQAVLQLTNTNEASQERAAAKAETPEEIEDLDITPRDQIIQLVEKSFPTQQFEQYVDENGKLQARPVVDAAGNPVQNREAVAMRDALIDKLASIRVPQGPLDMILDHFGIDTVAEVTGRSRRFVLKPDEKTGDMRRVEDRRSGSANLAETDAFQGGKKKILVFSEAGGTGRSYHADNTSASKDARRSHYLLQAGWRADKAVQGFGRTHRTNQASAPIVSLVTTDLQGQKRFISSIARRLSQLGALTKGQRQAGDQGVFSARDNLESHEARDALQQFYRDLDAGAVEGVNINEFESQTGLALRKKDEEGRSYGLREDLPPITQFLNRLLSLKIDTQNRVFDAFSARVDRMIEARARAGKLDVGVETARADHVTKDSERVVHTIEESGAETKYVKLTLADKFAPIEFADVASSKARPVVKWAKSQNGRVYAVADGGAFTNSDGRIVPEYRITNPVGGARYIEQHQIEQPRLVNREGEKAWNIIDKGEAQRLWKAEIDGAPEYVKRDLHLITGAILPIWDRLKGDTRVVRVQTDSGERLLGRTVARGQLADTLKRLGAEGEATHTTPADLYQHLIKGGSATLANGWKLSRRVVAGEQRIELKGPSSFSEAQALKSDGVFSERINFENRYFIPANEAAGAETLEKITKFRPVSSLGEGGGHVADAAISGDDVFSVRPATRTAAPARPIEQQLSSIIERVVGDRVNVRFSDTLPVSKEASAAWGAYGENAQTAAGSYSPAEHLIKLALNDPQYAGQAASTAYHEAFHAVEHLIWKEEGNDRAVLARENDRLENWIVKNMQFSGEPMTKEKLSTMAGYEIRAIAFEGYAQARDAGRDAKLGVDFIRKGFDKLLEIFRRIRNWLEGHGYRTAEDVFRDVYSGKVREQADAAERGTMEGAARAADRISERGEAYDLRGEGERDPVERPSRLRAAAERAMDLFDTAKSKVEPVAKEAMLHTVPMAAGSTDAMAMAKDFANEVRMARHEWSRRDDLLQKNFTPEQRAKMWDAANQVSEALVTGQSLGPREGLNALTDLERRATQSLQREADATFEVANDLGIIDAEGIPSYVPRIAIMVGATGRVSKPKSSGEGYSGNIEGIGRGFHTSTPQMKRRHYVTAAETEAAMKRRFGPNAQIARDIRALSLVTGELQEAIAARALVNRIKALGNITGAVTVSEGIEPQDGQGWFTLDHPAFKTYRPQLKRNPDTGKFEPAKHADGSVAFERVPIYIRNDFKGPLLAVLGKDNGKVYNAFMALKGKAMSMVMYSPVIHNLVEYSRSLPAYPLKVASTYIYWEGNRAKNDAMQMREAIRAGLVPIGKRFFNQDITSIMEEPNLAPGRSWTSSVLSFVPGLFNARAGDAVRRGVDKAGDVWHNKLLWDRVADLQMGLYVNMRRDLIRKGHDAQTASRVAAHFANRYAGALPIEAMSTAARKFANMLLFSRTFTFGNLGAMKDVFTGLPRDVQAQILRDAGPEGLGKIKNFARRKSIAILMLDIALGIVTTSLMQDALKKLRGQDWTGENGLFADYYRRFIKLVEHTGDKPLDTVLHPIDALWKLSSTQTNEPNKREGMNARVMLFRDSRGRAIYGRNPFGKIGEEFTGWPTAPGDMLMRKLGTFAKPAIGALMNDKYAGAGFDRPTPVWRPNPEGAEWVMNAGRIARHFMEAQLPSEAGYSLADILAEKSKRDSMTNALKIGGPFAGISISQGHPGGYRGAIEADRARHKGLDKRFGRQ